MKINNHYLFIIFSSCLFIFSFAKPVVAENSNIVLEFYETSSYCNHCEEKKPIINDIDIFYGNNITILSYEVSTINIDNLTKFLDYGFETCPAVVVKNLSADEKFNVLFPYENITFENLKNAINYHLKGNYTEEKVEANSSKTYTATPGFELILIIFGIALLLLWKRKKIVV